MNYTLNQLRIFQKVVEHRSITKAAKDLKMTQPAVSIQLRNLQEQFDLSITEVLGRQIHITDFGLELYEIVSKILEEIEQIEYKSKAFKNIVAGKLKIAVVSTGKYVMPYFLNDFMQTYPGIDLVLDVTNRKEAVNSLINNEVDFGLFSMDMECPDFNSEFLMDGLLFLVGQKEVALPVASPLSELPLIFREEGSGTLDIMQKKIEQMNLRPKIRLQLRSNEAVKQAILAGLGYSVLPLVSIKDELLSGSLYIIPGPGFPVVNPWSLVWLKKKRLSPTSKAYLDYIKANKADIVSRHFGWMEEYK